MLIETMTYRSLSGHSAYPLLDELMVLAGEYLIFLLPIIAAVLWFRDREGRHEAILITATGCLTLGLAYLAGLYHDHPPPFTLMRTLVGGVPGNAFPSQHTAVTASIVWPLLHRYRRLGAIAAAGALGTAVARVYTGAHWPIDVLWALPISLFGYGLVLTIEERFHPIDVVLDWIEPRLPDALLQDDG